MWWFRSGKRVLTIGSVHLDTIALSRSDDPAEDVTHIGSITHSVGEVPTTSRRTSPPTMAARGAVSEAAVYSILPQHSVLTEIIKYKIDAARINSRFVRLFKEFNSRHVRGGGYVGILDDHRLVRQAVVDPAITMPTSSMIATRALPDLGTRMGGHAGAGRRSRRLDRQPRRRARARQRQAAVHLWSRWPASAVGSTATTRTWRRA